MLPVLSNKMPCLIGFGLEIAIFIGITRCAACTQGLNPCFNDACIGHNAYMMTLHVMLGKTDCASGMACSDLCQEGFDVRTKCLDK